jgi:hypothetical protein
MRIMIVSVVAVLAGCAAAPQSTINSPSQAAEQKSATSLATGAAAHSSETSAEATNAKADSFRVSAEYRMRQIKGETVYCRKTVVLGSRFEKQICMSLEELKAHEQRSQSMRDNMSEKTRLCTGAAGCANP